MNHLTTQLYSPKERSDYLLLEYIKEVYKSLPVNQFYKENISMSTFTMYNTITKYTGNKRSKNKDAILLLCFEYFLHQFNCNINMGDCKKILDLSSKHYSRAEIIFKECLIKFTIK